ncbi:MAG TPA: SseB family protein [Mycobacteriales bacterium]|nr:SseB family protein [Mycobacteriales bacterium]
MSDDGSPDPRLTDALHRWTAAPDPALRAEVLAALVDARVFLALAARAVSTAESATTGLVAEREADMALLSVQRTDGARALPVFTDGHAVQRWRDEARPVPVPGRLACATARDDAASALLLDPGTAAFVVDAAELATLADGGVPVPGSTVSTHRTRATLSAPAEPPDDQLLRALTGALADEPVRAARLLDGPDGPVLGVVPAGSPTPAELAGLADRVARRLGDVLPSAGLDLAAVPAAGPGVVVPLPPARRRGLFRRR